jgi:hypothetical protein
MPMTPERIAELEASHKALSDMVLKVEGEGYYCEECGLHELAAANELRKAKSDLRRYREALERIVRECGECGGTGIIRNDGPYSNCADCRIAKEALNAR